MRTGDRGQGTGDRKDQGRRGRVSVKICGLTRRDDALDALAAGADFLGFVFFPASRRRLDVDDCEWIREVPARKVGVFRDQDPDVVVEIRERAGLDLVQLHGNEPPELCAALGGPDRVWKAFPVAGAVDWAEVERFAGVAGILFDTASPTGGGTGRRFDWSALDGRPHGLTFWLAGGLTPETVGDAVRRLQPAGVDVASGVEAAVGRKDAARMRSFVAAVRATEEGEREATS